MKWKTALGFALISIICSAIILVFGINQSILESLELLAIMLSAGITNLRVFPVFIVILVTTLFSLPLGLLTINLININKQCALTKFAFGMSLGITLMTASFTLMGLIGIPITHFTLLTNYLILLLFLLVVNKRKGKGEGYKNIVNLHLNSTESFDKHIFFLFLLLFMITIYPALRYPAPNGTDWMDYGVRIQGIIHSSTITGFYFNDFVHATDSSLLFYPQGFFVFIDFLYHVSSIPVHILLLSFSYFIGFMILLMIYALGYNFFKNKYIAALAVVSVLAIGGLSRLETSGFTWIFSLFLSVVTIFLYYEMIKKYDLKKALLTGISLSALFMSNPVVALSIFLVLVSYIMLFVLRKIIAKNRLRFEYIQAHVIPLVIAMILSLPIFITNYVYMFSSDSSTFNGIASSISMRILSSLDAIYKMNGGVWFFTMPFHELNSVVGIIAFAPILIGLFFCLKQRKEYQKLITILLFSSLITYIVPHALNMPAPYWSADVLFVLPFSLLSAIGISETYKSISQSEKLKHRHISISHIMIFFIVLFVIFGFVQISPNLAYRSYQDAYFYASSANIDGALWLKENSDTDSIVLNSPEAIRGGWIPIVSDRETVYTRLHRRINKENWDIRAKECESTFYQPSTNTSYSIWKKHNISYIFVTSHWHDLGSFLKSPFLELKYFRNGVAIFKVNPMGVHTENNNLVHIEAEASELYGNAMIENWTCSWWGIFVKMPDDSKVVIELIPVKSSIQRDSKNNVATLRIKHSVGPVNFPLKVSMGREAYIIDRTSDKFRFITTEITFPKKILFQENTTELTIETINRNTPLPFPFTLFQSERLFFSFCPMVDWIEISTTDAGGVQEESYILKVPCVTLRDNTERPETIEVGSNVLSGTNQKRILKGVKIMLSKERIWKNPFGDGKAGKRILKLLEEVIA